MKKSWIVRMDEKAVSPVIATILMVAITVVLAAVLYVMVTGLINPGGGSAPTMSFTGATVVTGQGGNDWEFRVASVDRAESFGNYRISVLEGSVTMLAVTDMAATAPLIGTATTLHLNLTDLDSGGKLSGGDTFVVGNVLSQKSYHVVIFWKSSGNEIARRTFNS